MSMVRGQSADLSRPLMTAELGVALFSRRLRSTRCRGLRPGAGSRAASNQSTSKGSAMNVKTHVKVGGPWPDPGNPQPKQ